MYMLTTELLPSTLTHHTHTHTLTHTTHTHTHSHTHRMQSIRRSIRESFRRRRGTVSADDRKKIAESLNVEAGIKQSTSKGHRGRSSTEPASEMSPLHGRGAAKGRPETAPAQVLIYTCINILYYIYMYYTYRRPPRISAIQIVAQLDFKPYLASCPELPKLLKISVLKSQSLPTLNNTLESTSLYKRGVL